MQPAVVEVDEVGEVDVVEEDNMDGVDDVVGGSEDATARGWRCHAKKDDVGGCKSKQVKRGPGTRGGFRRANAREMYERFSLLLSLPLKWAMGVYL